MTTRAGRAIAAVTTAVALALTLVVAGCSSAASHAGTTTAPPTTLPRPVGVAPSVGCRASAQPPGTTRGTLTVGGHRRTYLITIPKATAPAPLVLLFHGFASSAEKFSDLTQLPQRAAARGMVTVAPDGTGHTWGAPDPAFVTALLHHVEQTTCVDLHRVFLTGFSAGAAFTISYGCEHPDEIAAIAPVAVDFVLGCTRPTSILVFHGTADPMVAYPAGGEGQSLPGVKVAGTPSDMAAWARLGRCHPTPTTRRRRHPGHVPHLDGLHRRHRGRALPHRRRRAHLAGSRPEQGHRAHHPAGQRHRPDPRLLRPPPARRLRGCFRW